MLLLLLTLSLVHVPGAPAEATVDPITGAIAPSARAMPSARRRWFIATSSSSGTAGTYELWGRRGRGVSLLPCAEPPRWRVAGREMLDRMSATILPGAVRQNGYVVRDLDVAIASWVAIGVGPWFTLREITQPNSRYRGQPSSPTLSIGFANSGPLQLELIQALDAGP